MACIKCGHYFCWLCGISLDKKDPYSHFNVPGTGSCHNRLFEGIILELIRSYIRGNVSISCTINAKNIILICNSIVLKCNFVILFYNENIFLGVEDDYVDDGDGDDW